MVENSTSYIIRVDPAIDQEDSFEVIETERLFTNVVCETDYRFTVQAKNEMIGLLSEISAPVEQRTVCYSGNALFACLLTCLFCLVVCNLFFFYLHHCSTIKLPSIPFPPFPSFYFYRR